MALRGRVYGIALFLFWTTSGFPSSVSAFAGSPAELNNEAVQLLAKNAPQEALPKLLTAFRALPQDPVVRRNLAECYLQLGVEKLLRRDYEGAVEFFQEGKGYAEQDPRFWVYGGVSLLKAGNAGAAEAQLNEALALADNDPSIRYLLGELYYSTGELYRARQVLEDAVAGQTADVRIQDLLQRVIQELPIEERMLSTQGGHFSVSYDGDLSADLGDETLAVLDDAYNELGSEFGFYPQVQVPVLIYARAVYDELTGAPEWSAGVYDGKIRIPVGRMSRLSEPFKASLYHEYSHVLIHFLARESIPAWLNEGLAEIAGRRLFTPPKGVAPLRFVPWSLLEKSFAGLDNAQVLSAYAQSYLFVAYLIDRYGRHVLNDVLVEVGRTGDFEQAVKRRYGEFAGDLQTLQEEWRLRAVDDAGLLRID